MLMKTDPKLTSGINVLWIKFFLTAVFSTMYVRDHQRPAFHEALGVDTDWYGQEVFRKTSDISKQIFPIMLDIDHPRWMPSLKRLQRASADMAAADRKTGLGKLVGKASAGTRAALAFVSLYTIPAKRNAVPAVTRLQPAY
jgi:magnesium-protoporphyrin IX monomethyl ester (oxidative) cyclase